MDTSDSESETGGILLSDVEDLTDDEDALEEQTYRRAYRDGWIACMEAHWSLIREAKLSFRIVREITWDFWESGRLWDWFRRRFDGRMEIPPMLSATHANPYSGEATRTKAERIRGYFPF